MFKVEIVYKSGKVETTKIEISKYVESLQILAKEQKTASIKILEVC
jgi:hypothetical protein